MLNGRECGVGIEHGTGADEDFAVVLTAQSLDDPDSARDCEGDFEDSDTACDQGVCGLDGVVGRACAQDWYEDFTSDDVKG